MEWDEQPLAMPRHPLCRQALLQQTSKPFRCLFLQTYLSPIAPDRREGSLLAPPTRCLRIKGRHLGCRHRIRTSSPGYEPGELPLLHHCDIFFVFSHFGIYIIPQFCLFVKICEYVEKEGTAAWQHNPSTIGPASRPHGLVCIPVTVIAGHWSE